MKPFNYIFAGILVLLLISSSVSLFFIGGYTSKTISIIITAIAVSLVTNGINRNFFSRIKDKDERNISIENIAKAKAFDFMGMVFGVLIIIFVILNRNLLTILLVVAAYLLIFIVYMAYHSKYHKEM